MSGVTGLWFGMAEFRPIAQWLSARRVLVLLGLAGWVGLIIVGSGPRADESNWIGLPELADLATVVFLVLVAMGLVAFVVLLRTPTTRAVVERPRGRFGMWIALGLLLLLVTTNPEIIERLRFDPEDLEAAEEDPGDVPFGELGELPPTVVEIDQGDVVVLLLIVGVGAGLWHWTRRRANELAAANSSKIVTPEAGLASLLDEATRLLSLDDEPRAAVMAAYANLEQALADEGYPRQRSETPTEHLERVVANISIDAGPVIELGRLYEVARFSDHSITARDRHQAITDLDRVRRQLAAKS